MKQIIFDLLSLADSLDSKNLHIEANLLDEFVFASKTNQFTEGNEVWLKLKNIIDPIPTQDEKQNKLRELIKQNDSTLNLLIDSFRSNNLEDYQKRIQNTSVFKYWRQLLLGLAELPM